MKKFVALFLVVVMCFLLTGCGSGGAVNGKCARCEKFDDLLDLLEDENYDGAIKEIENIEAGKKDDADNAGENNGVADENEANPQSVEITLDNWEEYFELCVYTNFNENGFGEFEYANTYYSLASKENLNVDCEKSDVTVEYTRTEEERPVTVDFENKKLTYGKGTDTFVSEPDVVTMYNISSYVSEEYDRGRYGTYLVGGYIDSLEDTSYYVTDIDVSRIQGTLYYTTRN